MVGCGLGLRPFSSATGSDRVVYRLLKAPSLPTSITQATPLPSNAGSVTFSSRMAKSRSDFRIMPPPFRHAQNAVLQPSFEKARFVLRAKLDVVQHQAEGARFVNWCGHAFRWFDPGGKLATSEIGLVMLLAPLQSPEKHFAELDIVVFGTGSPRHVNAGFDQLINVAKGKRVALRAVIIGIELAQRGAVYCGRGGIARGDATVDLVAAELDPADGAQQSYAEGLHRIAGFQRIASSTPRAAEGVINS